MMATGAAHNDLGRFGMEVFRASPRQADLMIVAGRVSQKMAPVLRQVYDQMAEPKWVISMGACASSGGMFNNYALVQGVGPGGPGRRVRARVPARTTVADARHPHTARGHPSGGAGTGVTDEPTAAEEEAESATEPTEPTDPLLAAVVADAPGATFDTIGGHDRVRVGRHEIVAAAQAAREAGFDLFIDLARHRPPSPPRDSLRGSRATRVDLAAAPHRPDGGRAG